MKLVVVVKLQKRSNWNVTRTKRKKIPVSLIVVLLLKVTEFFNIITTSCYAISFEKYNPNLTHRRKLWRRKSPNHRFFTIYTRDILQTVLKSYYEFRKNSQYAFWCAYNFYVQPSVSPQLSFHIKTCTIHICIYFRFSAVNNTLIDIFLSTLLHLAGY